MIFIKKAKNSNFSFKDYIDELNKVYQEGLIDGRVKLFHGTNKADKIFKEGLLGAFALDPGNITNKYNKNWGIGEKRHLIYLSKNKFMPYLINRKREDKFGIKGNNVLELNIPFDEYKKLKLTDNPETRGRTLESHIKDFIVKNPNIDKKKSDTFISKVLPSLYNDTVVVEGDISPEFIKYSPKYKKQTLKELISYIKNNPRRFGSGLISPFTSIGKIFTKNQSV